MPNCRVADFSTLDAFSPQNTIIWYIIIHTQNKNALKSETLGPVAQKIVGFTNSFRGGFYTQFRRRERVEEGERGQCLFAWWDMINVVGPDFRRQKVPYLFNQRTHGKTKTCWHWWWIKESNLDWHLTLTTSYIIWQMRHFPSRTYKCPS